MSSKPLKSDSSDPQKRQAYMQELQFLGQMASTETALFHQAVAASFDLGITDMKTISILMQEGSVPAGQIAERLHLTTGAITNVVDRLEKLGLVKRTADPNDRRKVVVQVNRGKLTKIQKAYKSIGDTFQQVLRGYTTEELKFLVDYYKVSIELTKTEIAKITKG